MEEGRWTDGQKEGDQSSECVGGETDGRTDVRLVLDAAAAPPPLPCNELLPPSRPIEKVGYVDIALSFR